MLLIEKSTGLSLSETSYHVLRAEIRNITRMVWRLEGFRAYI